MNATERQKIKCQSGKMFDAKIENLKYLVQFWFWRRHNSKSALNLLKKCVAELHSCYFAKNAIEKRLAKNVVKKKGKRTHEYCPCCNDELEYIDWHYKFCPNCGQKLLWNNDGKEETMTIKELYRYALNNCIETMPIQYGFVDDDGIYHPDYFRFANFDYNPNNVTMMFYVAGDKEAKGLQKNTGSIMEYVGAGDDAAMGVYKCSQCGSEVQSYEYYDFCPWCGNKIKGWTE